MPSQKLSAGDVGHEVAQVHTQLAAQGLEVSSSESSRKLFGPATRAAVSEFQKQNQLPQTGEVDASTAVALSGAQPVTTAVGASIQSSGSGVLMPQAPVAALSSGVAAVIAAGGVAPSAGTSNAGRTGVGAVSGVAAGGLVGAVGGGVATGATARVSGTIALEHGPPAVALKLRLYQLDFGGGRTLLGEVATDAQGGYTMPYSVQGAANVEVYAVGANNAEVQLSRTKFGAAADEKLDLVAPTQLQPPLSEFSRLKTAIAPHLATPDLLKLAVERGDRRDISVLASNAQWDARSLALASSAYENADATKMPVDALYALHRVGFPTDLKALARVEAQSVTTALQQAAQAGIIDAGVVDAGVAAFGAFAADRRLAFTPAGKLGSLTDFVSRAPISEADRAAFTSTLRQDGPGGIWDRAKAAGTSDDGLSKLRLQGQLAYLTLNNPELVADLQTKLTTLDPKQLIDLDFDLATTWVSEISALAANDDARLGKLIPPAVEGLNNSVRLQTYSDELARRVRQMDAHRVTLRHLARGDLDAIDANLRPDVHALLSSASAKAFTLGQTPLGSFLATNPVETLLPAATAEQRGVALDQVKAIHRVYSVSTSDRTLNLLLKKGFRSAQDIVRLPYADFAALLGPEIGTVHETRQIYWKAQQVSATVINVFTGARQLSANTPLAATGATGTVRTDRVQQAQESLTGKFPTLESLFGSVDFCECEECRSVLSPAAYLVDILHFIDTKEPQWTHQKALWSMAQGEPKKQYDDAYQKPFDVLASRRPDIPFIALSCENTQTALPYIDIVNEILELLVVGGTGSLVAFDTGTTSSADLIAEPQNVTWEAYVGGSAKPGLNAAVFPTTLPFDLPLELVRAFLTQLGLPLWKLRKDVGRPLTLAPTSGTANGLSDVWLERLGLGPADVQALLGKPWFMLYGYADEVTALAELTNAKTLSRCLGVSYVELVELMKTGFVNPAIDNMVVVHALGVDLHDIERYFNPAPEAALSAQERAAFEARLAGLKLLPADVQALWTDAVREKALLLRSPDVDCDFGKTTLVFAKPPADSGPALAFALLRLSAFVRLRGKLGWTTAELDAALRVFVRPAGGLSAGNWGDALGTALIYLSHLDEIAQRAPDQVSREELLLLWAAVPATGVSSLYERLFLGSGALARDPAFESPTGSYLTGGTALVSEHAEAIRQATGLSPDDIDQIFASSAIQNPKLSLDNLSLLLRHQVLARLLDISVAELLVYLALSGKQPFATLSAGPLQKLDDDAPFVHTLVFLREVDLLREAGLDASSLDALCRHRGATVEAEDWNELAGRLLVALSALPKPASPPTNTGPGPQTPAQIAEQQQAAERARLAIVQTLSSQLSAPEPLTATLVTSILREPGSGKPLIDESLTARAEPLATRGSVWAVYVWFAAAGSYTLASSGGATATLKFGRDDDLQSVVNDSGTFQLSDVVAGVRYRLELALSAPGTLQVQGASSPIGVSIDSYARLSIAIARLRKALDLLLALETTDAELSYLRALPGALTLDALPLALVTDATAAKATFAALLPWLDLTAARRKLGPGKRVVDVLAAARRTYDTPKQDAQFLSDFDAALAALTGWKPDFVQRTRTALGYAVKTTQAATTWTLELSELTTGSGLRALVDAGSALSRLGLNPDDVVRWAKQPVDRGVATKLRAAVKGRYAPSAWRHVAQPLFDGLRKKQRDALVAYLTHLPGAPFGQTQDELFESLLFDPGTEPPVLASRIQLAISSVQLFVQRCLMSLEPQVASSIVDAKRWEWMSRYRLWEVNRKMFLWPENLLDSVFRDDKTHLFRELEATMLQGDVSDDLVRGALYKYLTDFERIARLDMMTMYFEPGVSAASTVHVIGRTQQAPFKYFYRSCSSRMWTPWEPLGIEVEGDHLALTVWRGRMHLFWVTFFAKAESNSTVSSTTITEASKLTSREMAADTAIQLQLHWVEQIQGKWVNRSSTSTFVDAPLFRNARAADAKEKREGFFVRVVVDPMGTKELGDDVLELHISHGSVAHRFVLFSKLAPPGFDECGAGPATPPFAGGAPEATKWIGLDSLQAEFISDETQTDGQITSRQAAPFTLLEQSPSYSLLFPSNEIRLDETESVPRAAGTPAGYVFAPQGAQHVVYRAQDSNIHDLWWTPNGWFHSNASAAAGAEPATSDPHGYPLDEQYMQCVAYVSDKKLLELSWSQLDALGPNADGDPTAAWRVDTLLDGALDPQMLPVGRPLGGVFTPKRGVIVRTADSRLLAAVEGPTAGTWNVQSLIPDGVPLASGNPTGFALMQTTAGVSKVLSRHVFYLGTDGHIHELRFTPPSSPVALGLWVHTDLTVAASAPASASDSQPASYAFLGQQSLHVVYRSADGVIHELYAGATGSWAHNPIGAVFGKAAGDPAGYVTERYGVQHVVYRGVDQHIHELWWDAGGWHENVLTNAVRDAPLAAGEPAGYSFESQGTQHVVYRAEDGGLRELWWAPYSWNLGHYELAKPDLDPIGPLVAPFFFEDRTLPYTFFVEPSLAERTIHDWEEYVVTTEEYVRDRIPFPTGVKQWFRDEVKITPSEVGVLTSPPVLGGDLLNAQVLVATKKGVFSASGAVRPTAQLQTPAATAESAVPRIRLADAAQGVLSRESGLASVMRMGGK